MVFPVVTYSGESWTVKKEEWQRIGAFELWSWRRLLRVPWTARSTQSILREINPKYSLEGLILKLQYFGHLMWTDDSLEKSLMLGKIEGRRRRGHQRMSWMDGITDAMKVKLGELREVVRDREARRAAVHGIPKRRTWLGNWTTTQKPGARKRQNCLNTRQGKREGACSATQLRQTLWDPTDYDLPGSSVHGLLQARILECVAMPSSRGSYQSRDQTHIPYVSCTGRLVLYH